MHRVTRPATEPVRLRTAVVLLAAVVATLFVAVPAGAATVYRCGNTFQDQPCVETKPADTRPAATTPTREVATPRSTTDVATRPAAKADDAATRVVVLDARR